MAFEFILHDQQFHELAVITSIVSCIRKCESFYELQNHPTLNRLELAFSFDSTPRKEWPEDFTISVEENEFYLCFHSATLAQRTSVIEALTTCLNKNGITTAFEEV
jgi:hypothetical protein